MWHHIIVKSCAKFCGDLYKFRQLNILKSLLIFLNHFPQPVSLRIYSIFYKSVNLFLVTRALVQTGYWNICVVFLTFVVCSRRLCKVRRCRISNNTLVPSVNYPKAVICIPIHFKNDTVWLHITVKNCAKS